ncbi:hypothetical protein XELAEV_18000190mg [Xenopus laevis]|uniref:Uncharacterized protein n=1 Tax=Xenopus laevis TaxID=8355 RepID=A0A974BQH7_XENLA|nr:hypothetical protein XELAEV_18000190mg [Xenopus laevis]
MVIVHGAVVVILTEPNMAAPRFESSQPIEKEMLDTGRRFIWAGVFGQKLTSRGAVRLLPLCGGCGAEAHWHIMDVSGRCPACQRPFFQGPLFVRGRADEDRQLMDRRLQRWEDRYPVTANEATQTVLADAAILEDLAEETETLPEETPLPSYSEEEATAAPAVSAPLPLGRGYRVAPRGRESQAGAIRPGSQVGRDPAQAAVTPLPPGLSSEESPWEEDRELGTVQVGPSSLAPVLEAPTAAEQEGEAAAVVMAAVPPREVVPSPHSVLINDVTSFWVLPGEAPVKEYRALSRVQKKMNLEVSKKWGYYMPYAPEHVYLEVSLLLEDWIHEDILDYLKMDRDSLTQHDRDARRRAKDLVQEKLPMWWLGRTILRTYVRSICKRAPKRHYSKDVPNDKGGYTEKPHPAYYVSFEDTKCWFHKMI